MKIPKVFTHILESNTRLIPILGILVLALAIPITLNLIEYNQDNRQQAAPPPVSVQTTDPGNGGTAAPGPCEPQGQCIKTDEWATDPAICVGANVVNRLFTCQAANEICCLDKTISEKFQTCTEVTGSKECLTASECEAKYGAGNCSVEADEYCINSFATGKVCMVITSGSANPQQCTGQCHASLDDCSQNNPGKICAQDPQKTCNTSGTSCFTVSEQTTPAHCSIASNGLQYCCPSGSTYCGKTSDTSCPLCVTNPQTCENGTRWSVAACSNLGGGAPTSCTAETDCTGLPHSCSAGQTVTWYCQNNSEGTGKHCAHSCTPLTP